MRCAARSQPGTGSQLPTLRRLPAAAVLLCALALALSAHPAAAAPAPAAQPAAAAPALPESTPSPARVLEVQRLLVALGYPLGNLPLGGLGPRTKGAIEYFQRKYGLPVTGLPDPWTVAAMKGVVASLRGVGTAPQSQPHDLVEETIGDRVPILTIAVLLALVLALLALSSRRGRGQDSATNEDTGPAASRES